MQKLLIEGGSRLYGSVPIGGMKNSALPIIYATILVQNECIIENIPRVSDIENSLQILREMGALAEFIGQNTVIINTSNLSSEIKCGDLVSKMRASSYLMGVMLARFGRVEMPLPGGCNFGSRPIDLHIKGFCALGASAQISKGIVKISAKNTLKCEKITLDKISVGATINMMLASVYTNGVTVIENAAIEPHVDDVICFLNTAGAKIMRYGRHIYIIGVKELKGVKYKIFPDMIEALTYFTFLGATGGEIELLSIKPEHLSYPLGIFEEMGFKIVIKDDTINIKVDEMLVGTSVETNPYPLFPTDLHPQLSALFCFTKNGGQINENIFPTRFAYVNELKKMGANIKKSGSSVQIKPSILKGAVLDATDLRAGAALITAALGAEGISEINNVNYIVRGYEHIVQKITSLGGKIKII